MNLNNRQREYLAESFAKVGEYLVSIVILGQLVAEKIDLWLTLIAGASFAVAMTMGTFILRKVEEKNEA